MAVKTLTDIDFESIIANNPKVIVKYIASWCGACKLFAPKFRRFSENENYSTVLFVEIDAEENELARKLGGVNNLPFIATFKSGVLLEGQATSKEERVIELIENLNA